MENINSHTWSLFDNMEKIYIAHSTHFDYENELYAPLSEIKNFQFIFPHQQGSKPKYSRDVIKSCALLLAEVSVPSLGTGIEVGWANAYGIPVVFMHKKDIKISSSLKLVSSNFLEYDDLAQKKEKIIEIIKKIIFKN